MSEFYKEPEELLDAMVTYMKKETVDGKGTVEYGDDDDMVTLFQPLDASLLSPNATTLPGTEGLSHRRLVTVDRENNRIVSCSTLTKETEDGVEEDPENETTFQLYTNPLRVGCWMVRTNSESKRKVASHYEAVMLSWMLNRMVGEEEILKEIEGLDEKNFYF
mmetsp:Transcript_20615/g.57958  ORF Transcript_20615/g.57958 Transcript_20615/m.57958 type:complete len:163 (+) Transcript_20615:694-1182(+)